MLGNPCTTMKLNETLHTLNSAWGISTCGMLFDTITITILLKYMNIVIIPQPQGGKSLTEDI